MNFENFLIQVAEKTLENGGTASIPATGKFLPPRDVWSFPKYPSKTAILPPTVDLITELRNFIIQNEVFLNEEDCWLGTWVHPQTREFYLDIAMGVEGLEDAKETAKCISIEDGRMIVAIFNARQNKTVFLWED
jgi:hypothetical protein